MISNKTQGAKNFTNIVKAILFHIEMCTVFLSFNFSFVFKYLHVHIVGALNGTLNMVFKYCHRHALLLFKVSR
jgi:hypothetical protein